MALKPEDKFERLLKKFLPKILKAIKIDYGLGSALALQNSKINGKKTNLNPLSLSKKDQDANINIIETLIKDVNSEVAKKINYIVNKNITEKGSNVDLAKNLKDLFNDEVPGHFTYKNRFKTIARTESTRILSESSMNTAKRLKASKKYLVMVDDKRTSDVSRALNKKYGTPEQAIPIDEEFKVNVNGREYSGLTTPIHPNDRDLVIYTFD